MGRSTDAPQGNFLTKPPVCDYEPAHVLRCHSNDNDPDNNDVKVWHCSFKPEEAGDNVNMLATCGGNIVCFIDCMSGKVIRRYKDNDPKEVFYCLAWTSVEGQTGGKDTIIAVGGARGFIKLLHPQQLVLFATITAHKKYISCLLFHPKKKHLLFSGANDGLIILWDIGSPDFTKHNTVFRPLLKFDVPGTEALNLVYSPSVNVLLAACEAGCYGWNVRAHLEGVEKRRTVKVVMSADYDFKLTKDPVPVDGLELLPGNIVATKTVGSGEIHLWNLIDNIAGSKKSSTRVIKVDVLVKLEYISTDVAYLNLGYASGLLCVGDDLGNLYVYNITKSIKKSDGTFVPSKIIEWSCPEVNPLSGISQDLINKKKIIVNSVGLSANSDYIAFATDNNLVCILRKDKTTGRL